MDEDEAFYTERNLPKFAYVFIDGAEPGKRIGIVKRGESGYHLTDYDRAHREEKFAREIIDRLNDRLGVTKVQADAMHIGSMLGWSVPGADATRYDEAGNQRPAMQERSRP